MASSTKFAILSFIFFIALSWGAAHAGWVENGKPICDAPGEQWYPRMIPDGAGGGIVIWQDYRAGSGNVYAQRIDPDGEILWRSNGVSASGNDQDREFFRQAVPDGSGGVILTWMDHRGGGVDIYAQRISAEGNPLWDPDGLYISPAEEDNYYPVIIADGAGGATIAWQSGIDSTSQIFIQKLDEYGNMEWPAGGLAVSTEQGSINPSLLADGAGGVIVAWISTSTGTGILAQRISAAGTRQWGDSGRPVCPGGVVHGFVPLCGDGAGGAIIAWHDIRGGNHDIYVQRISASGDPLWDPDGSLVRGGAGDQWHPGIIPADGGGCLIAWMDSEGEDSDIYMQRINASGGLEWEAGGTVVCSAAGYQLNPRLASDGGGGAIISWQDRREGDFDIYVQRVDEAGSLRWAGDGVAVARSAGEQRLPEIVPDETGGALLTWEGGDEESNIYCQRITASGGFVAVNLAGFTAVRNRGGVEITWRLREIDMRATFIILRSADGGLFFTNLLEAEIRCRDGEYFFRDEDLPPGGDYRYRVMVRDDRGQRVLFETESIGFPFREAVMRQNYPNPFNPVTTISYYLPERTRVILAVYDPAGNRVRCLVNEMADRGEHLVEWNGRDEGGRTVSSGVYFYRLRAGKEEFSRKMILLK
ncbi:MAG: T9SS type A sorting domain-containing protein [Candidatus Krumholzibacteriota bacterium]|nr:T9SS type A sorting domain-containing protein [Candidatus Krumholzibacteriota bacterium]